MYMHVYMYTCTCVCVELSCYLCNAVLRQLQEYESSQSLWQRVKVGGVISEGEREELKSSIEEQETILRGYQKVHVYMLYP